MIEQWLNELKSDPRAGEVGMYLIHNGVVRATSRATVREGRRDVGKVTGLMLSYDADKAEAAVCDALNMPGIVFVRYHIFEGNLKVGDDMMYVLVAGDIRPHVMEALNILVGRLKSECVTETELFE